MRKLVFVLLVTLCSSAFADSSRLSIPDLYQTKASQWRGVHSQMSSREYRQAARHNRGKVAKAMSNYLEGKILSLGIPEKGVTAAGALVGFAFNGARLNLNKSKTMAFEVTDVVEQNPALMFKFNTMAFEVTDVVEQNPALMFKVNMDW